MSIISNKTYLKSFKYLPINKFDENITLYAANGSPLPYLGIIKLSIRLPLAVSRTNDPVLAKFLVCDTNSQSSLFDKAIIGTNVFEEFWKSDSKKTPNCLANVIYKTLDKANVCHLEKSDLFAVLNVNLSKKKCLSTT